VPIDPKRFHDSFFDEVAEHLERLEELVLAAGQATATRADFDALFRAAHSIKGASGTFGFREMAELTHDLESLLDRIREGVLVLSTATVDAVLRSGDVLREQLAAYRAGAQPNEASASAIRAVLQSLLEVNRFSIAFSTTREEARANSAIASLLSTLRELGECSVLRTDAAGFECKFSGSQSAREIEELFSYVVLDADVLRIDAIVAMPSLEQSDDFGFFDDDPEVRSPAQPQLVQHSDETSVRVRLQKIDGLVDLVGEMLIAQSSLHDRVGRLDATEHADLYAALLDLQRHTREVREQVLSIRMLPVGSIFNRFPRMVHELASKLNKEVAFESSGGDTELDKGLIEAIVDPLTHIIRNAIDHGIESRETRRAAGKPERGTIAVRSFQRGGSVVIEVRDDGAGMDRERILSKARESSMSLREEMSDRDVWALVCAPGFSTAQEITDVSGRGVGMDVVKKNINSLGGKVEIDSLAGAGTTISLVVPLTLAILDGLAVGTGDETLILPLTSITESIAIRADEVVSPAEYQSFVMYRGQPLPLVAVPGRSVELRDGDNLAVVLESDGNRAALLVDSLESEHQVVIKSLERNFRRVDGFSGATVLGNGNVALILDVPALLAR
jgi:two-component system chemotaxis sensor kinase CheA